MKIYKQTSVYQESINRIKRLFDELENISILLTQHKGRASFHAWPLRRVAGISPIIGALMRPFPRCI